MLPGAITPSVDDPSDGIESSGATVPEGSAADATGATGADDRGKSGTDSPRVSDADTPGVSDADARGVPDDDSTGESGALIQRVAGSEASASGRRHSADEGADREPALRSDPRIRGEHVRVIRVRAADTHVVLVGVVHDHPASCYRAAAVVEDVSPAVLALELPELAIPLFEKFAAGPEGSDPGGEMSAAVRAAGDVDVRGIDVPSATFARALAGTLRAVSPSADDLVDVAKRVADVTRHAIGCRLAALSVTGVDRDPPIDVHEYDCDRTDPPAVQASNEATRLGQSRSLLNAVDPPVATRVTDAARERAMARRLAALGRTGDVVAVLGFGHLDEVADELSRLAGTAEPSDSA